MSAREGFVLLVGPGEVRQLLGREWPDDAWLALARDGAGNCRWEAGPASALVDMACGRPVWPPVPGLAEAEVGAEEEAALLRWALSGVAVEPPAPAVVLPHETEAELQWDE